MTTLTFSIDGADNLRTSITIPDIATPRILAWLTSPDSGYGVVKENVQHSEPDMDWTPSKGETEADRPLKEWQAWETRPATVEEAANAFAASTLRGLLSSTVEWERAKAAQAAAAAVEPIV